MSLTIRQLSIGAILVVALLIALALLWPRAADDGESLHVEVDLSPPIDFPQHWADQAVGDTIRVDSDEELLWSAGSGSFLMQGPTLDGLEMQWSSEEYEGWTVLSAEAQDSDIGVLGRIWTAPGFPAAIIELDAHIAGAALAEPLTATTVVPGGDGELLSAGLKRRSTDGGAIDRFPILAGRFGSLGPTLQIHSPGAAMGHTVEAGDTDELAIQWTLWPGLDDAGECLADDAATRTISMRLIVEFGDHPLVAALPVPPGTQAMSTPIFVDAPNIQGDPWADGRARNAGDMARRLRALAYGHSDRSDPRYGNGGLLAADMGAIFAIDPQWWHDESMQGLRRSLEGTDIELVPRGSVDDLETLSPGVQISTEDPCAALFPPGTDGDAPPPILERTDGDRSFDQALAAPLLPLAKVGEATTGRDALLDRLFASDHEGALFASGEHRTLFVPLVATRNPLKDIFEDNLLSPERGGHWMPHDAFARRLSRHELSDSTHQLHSTGFEALQRRRNTARKALSFWSPEGTLEHHENTSDALYFFGALDALSIDADAQRRAFASTALDTTSPPTFSGSLSAIDIEFDSMVDQD